MKKILSILMVMMMGVSCVMAQTPHRMRERLICYQGESSGRSGANGAHKLGIPGTGKIPCVGSPKIPVILVGFSDKSFTISRDEYDLFCNGRRDGSIYMDHGSFGSVRDYFAMVSDSAFMPEFEVVGPVTLQNGFAFYGKDSGRTHDVNLASFFREACEAAVKQSALDWHSFDNNNDGTIDFAFFIYAGEGQNAFVDSTELIWPQERATEQVIDTEGGKLTFGGFGCTNEVYMGLLDGTGTMIHELSHGLGLCDHYDYNYRLFGMDCWDVMDSGNYCNDSYNPCGYSGYELDFMGWRAIREIPLGTDTTLVLQPISDGGVCYRLTSSVDPNDYYTLENRQNRKDSHDLYLGLKYKVPEYIGKTHGLMITHFNYERRAWVGNFVNTGDEHLTIVHADNITLSAMDYENYKTTLYGYLDSMTGDLFPGACRVQETTILGQHLRITEEENGDIVLTINNGATPTGVGVVKSDAPSGVYYDLSGRRLTGYPTHRGVYIVNGKKVVKE